MLKEKNEAKRTTRHSLTFTLHNTFLSTIRKASFTIPSFWRRIKEGWAVDTVDASSLTVVVLFNSVITLVWSDLHLASGTINTRTHRVKTLLKLSVTSISPNVSSGSGSSCDLFERAVGVLTIGSFLLSYTCLEVYRSLDQDHFHLKHRYMYLNPKKNYEK